MTLALQAPVCGHACTEAGRVPCPAHQLPQEPLGKGKALQEPEWCQ